MFINYRSLGTLCNYSGRLCTLSLFVAGLPPAVNLYMFNPPGLVTSLAHFSVVKKSHPNAQEVTESAPLVPSDQIHLATVAHLQSSEGNSSHWGHKY